MPFESCLEGVSVRRQGGKEQSRFLAKSRRKNEVSKSTKDFEKNHASTKQQNDK